MDNATLMYIVLGLLVIFFIVLIIFSAKRWGVLHIVSAVFVFLAALVFVWMSAATLRTHQHWRSAVNALQKKIEAEQAEQQRLLVGELTKAEQTEDSIRDLEAAVQRALLDRGRVWRNCAPEVAADSIVLTVEGTLVPAGPDEVEPEPDGEPPADDAEAEPEAGDEEGAEDPADEEPADDAPPVRRHDIEASTILYGFLEGESRLSGELGGYTVPSVYLGEFRVVSRTDTTVTLQPTARLSPLQQSSLAAGSWTLYDNMPVDAHFAFEGLSEGELKALFPLEKMTISDAQYSARITQLASYFEGISTADLTAKIPKNRMLMDQAEYQQFIDQYVRDGEPAEPDDPPSHIWKRVKFKVPTSIQVDAVLTDASGSTLSANFTQQAAVAVKRQAGEVVIAVPALVTGKPGDSNLGPFPLSITATEGLKGVSDWDIPELWDDTQTPARLKTLNELTEKELDAVREAKSVLLDIDDEALVHPATARFLVENDIAEEVGAIYVRPLKDYAVFFNDSHRQELLFEDSARVIRQDTLTLIQANERAKEQETYRADERAKLLADRAGFRREQAAITAVAEAMQRRYVATRERLSQLYRTNLQLAEQVRAIQMRRVADYMEREEAAPAAPSTPAGSDATLSAP